MSCTDKDEDIMMPPLDVGCPCDGCPGILRSDGRNTNNSLTFLECDECFHCYSARDSVKPIVEPANPFEMGIGEPLEAVEDTRLCIEAVCQGCGEHWLGYRVPNRCASCKSTDFLIELP